MTENITEKRRKERQRIIQTAREVFKKFGYKKTAVNDVAAAANKAKSSVYYYFKSKDEIYNAVVFYEAKQYRSEVLSKIKTIENPEKQLKEYIIIRLQTDKIFSNFYNAVNGSFENSDFIRRLKKIYDEEEFRIFSRILKNGTEKGFFEIIDIKYASVGIVTAMRGIESTLLHAEGDPHTEEKIDNILKIILYGIVKR